MMSASPELPPSPTSARSIVAVVRSFFLHRLSGRLLLGGGAAKLLASGLGATLPAVGAAVQWLSTAGGVALAAGTAIVGFKLVHVARQHLLWRVRRKLIISYIFIGVVPAILIVIFGVLAAWLLFWNLSAYLIRSALGDLADEATYLTGSAAIELARMPDAASAQALLHRRQAADARLYPGMSLAIVPVADRRCPPRDQPAASDANRPGAARRHPLASLRLGAGPQQPLVVPDEIPAWITCGGFSGVLAHQTGPVRAADGDVQLVIRAVSLVGSQAGFAVVADLPFSDAVKGRMETATGLVIGQASLVDESPDSRGRQAPTPMLPSLPKPHPGQPSRFTSVALLDHVEWSTGTAKPLTIQVGVSVREIYARLSVSQASPGTRSVGDQLVVVLLLVSILFLIIEVAALALGWELARSITGSIHELFAGTERVRQGDFGHRIPVLAKDQLGELADSFNQMTGSIEDLLRTAAEKKRLEEEMRLAREIQMSLLPHGPLQIPGLAVSAVCVPAREVGGDYYDVLPLPDGRVGLIIADVSGKGMSAALYMAELKGLMLSLSQIHTSPRQLLMTANRLISDHLDSRSFITMTYAVFDPARRTFTYARAGHTPLMYLQRADQADPSVQILTPDGMVLGLKLDRGEMFDLLLCEETLHLLPGDLLMLFTDGISEAMDESSECFGEPRLARLIEKHGHLAFEELRERVLREIEAFVGGAPQHDDMTMILLKVDQPNDGPECGTST
ncbi:MAG: SpoIIE family protein phosphatase [Acidobacteriota bacterium]